MDNRGRRSFLKHEKVHRDIANGHNTNRRRNLAELDYPELEKLILALIHAAKRLLRTYLADFLVEAPSAEDRETKVEETKGKGLRPENAWKLFTDIASSSDGSGAGLMLVSIEGKEYTYAFRFEFKTTNNEAKYEALLAGLRIAVEMKIQELAIFVDSQLVANQNKKADALSKLALMKFSKLAKEARKLQIKAPQYRMIDDKLYRKSYLSPWLRCIGPVKAKSIIQEIHQGSCEMHAGPRSVVSKITKLGYYWPSMNIDTKALIQRCEACHIHSSIPRKPKQEMTPITSTWPFSQ
ncbi:reverse transcriptase domain-containing protein [Tanacetum coccineum]